MNKSQADCDRQSLGAVHGRFQPFHKGHLTYVRLALERFERLIIGITNPDHRHLVSDPADPQRHLPFANPLTFFERLNIIRGCLSEAGVDSVRFDIVPFPIDDMRLLHDYCPRVLVLLRERGEWTRRKVARLNDAGWPTQILSDTTDLDISATDIRRRIVALQPWNDLVPPYCAMELLRLKVAERLKLL